MNLMCPTTVIVTLTLLGTPYGAADMLTPARPKRYTIPIVDISGEKQRQVVVEWGTPTLYQGHVHTLLMPDGKTLWAVWTHLHAGPCGPIKKSTDGGLTWNWVNNGPSNLAKIYNCPTIHRLIDPAGKVRLFIFAGNRPQCQGYSADDGQSWSPMRPNGLNGIVAPMRVVSVEKGQKLLMWYDWGPTDMTTSIWQAESTDGGLTWAHARQLIADGGASPNEPDVIRSPDGKQLLMLIRVEKGGFNSLYATSDDEGTTWTAPRELPASLTGHRHNARYAPDGRMVVVMRDTAEFSPTRGSFVAWVGKYEDIIKGREGQYRAKLLHQYSKSNPLDCGYAGLEVLPDGTLVATTYIKYTPGPELNSIVSVRFKLSELDAKIATGPQTP